MDYNNYLFIQKDEVLWIFLSLLVLPTDEQIYLIGGLTDDEKIIQNKFFISNSKLLICVLSRCYTSWVDDFDFLYDFNLNKTSSLQDDFEKAILEAGAFTLYKKNFIHRIEWNNLRHFAKIILEKSGLPAYPIKKPIDFNNFMQIVINPIDGSLWIEW